MIQVIYYFKVVISNETTEMQGNRRNVSEKQCKIMK